MAHPSQDHLQLLENAFCNRNKTEAEKLLSKQHSRVATIRTSISKQKPQFSGNPTRLEKALEIELAAVSPLHLAAYWGWKTVVTTLVSEFQCAVNCKDDLNHNPLHYAACNGRLEVVKYLIEELHCNPLEGNDIGDLALHYACNNGHRDITRYLIKEKHCDPSCENQRGNTPLHYACQNGHLKIAQYLIEKCDPKCALCKDKIGNTPLHFACCNGHFNIVKYLISKGCDPSCENEELRTPLHLACGTNGTSQFEIVKYLVNEKQCDPSHETKYKYTPFHEACGNGHLKIAKFFFDKKGCDPSFADHHGTTPLHFACMNGRLNIVRYLIDEKKCDPSRADESGWTPLHYACSINHAEIVDYLLSTRRVNLLAKNSEGFTALYYASGKYETMKLFQPFEECRTEFQVLTSTKLILTGDSKVGKTTIAKHIKRIAESEASSTAKECITDVQHLTAGIIPHCIQSKQLGNFVMYDFAGQQEYYSSHAAVLEQVMRRSAAIFLCVVDLSKNKEKIRESLDYWLSFIDNACSLTETKSHVLIVGSHADQLTPSAVEEKVSQLKTIINIRKVKYQVCVDCIAMDCRETNTNASNRLIATFTNSQKAIIVSQPIIHYDSHVVYAFLQTKLNKVGCTLEELISRINEENDSSLPKDRSVLTKILKTLSDKGLILYLQHDHQSSWIIVKTEVLLSEIIGTLFAPDHFKEHRDLASNTGIVTVSSLCKVFPDYNSEMLVEFFTLFEFCQRVDSSLLCYTNLQTIPTHATDHLLFFPGLVQSERPDSLIQRQGKLKFGWCLKSIDPHGFFSSRFLHILLLSVAYKFALARQADSSSLHRVCIVWRNGIFWRNLDNIITVIELLDKNRCVLVAMSSDDTSPVEHAELRSSVIALVRHLQQKYCSHLNVREFLISPDLIQRYPLNLNSDNDLPDSDLFDIHHVAQCMLLHKQVIPSYEDGRGYLTAKEFLFEPYYQLSSSSIGQLVNPSMADQPVPGPLLQEVHVMQLCRQCEEFQTVNELKEHLDKLSLFTGKNLLEVAGLKEKDLPSDRPTAAGSSSTLSIDDLFEVEMFLQNVNKWQRLGLALGLLYPTLERIDENQHGDIEKCRTEMIAAWMRRKDNVSKYGAPSWIVLQTALRKIDENDLADKIITS